ncbi:MAG: glycosyltransferase family 4 protein [Treponema sp.]|nr:glycosyltransferase family 4 protein [Treponema sp.]
MKIAIDCRMLGSGGIGTYLESLLPFFLKDFDCLLFGKKELIQSVIPEQKTAAIVVDCNIKPFSLKELFFFSKGLLKLINQCDIYYTPYCNIPHGIKIPVFSTIHDVVFLDIPSLTSRIGVMARKFFYQRGINKSKKIFTVSNFSALRINANLKLHNKKVIVTYNSVPKWFTDKSENISKEHFLLFVGNIKKHKGLHTLLMAFDIISKQDDKLKLVIVGNSENFRTEDDSIKKLINSFPNGKILFTGRISNEEVRSYYETAKLLIQPSFYEGFGMPPLEALYCGTNVVISDIPVFMEIYKDFPVTYFHCGDSNDLAQKIQNSLDKDKPKIINRVYSFDRTYNIIKEELV